MKHHDAVAGGEIRYVSTDCGHGVGSLVSENARGGMRAGSNFLQIRAADPTSLDFDQYLAGADFWNRNRFEPHVVHPAINRGEHG